MSTYSLWRDACASRKLQKWEPDYEDDRARVTSMEIVSKAYKQLCDILEVAMLLIFIAAVEVYHADVHIRLDTVLEVALYTLFCIICLTQYIALYRLAGQGLIRYNKVAGSMLFGILLPFWFDNLCGVVFDLIFGDDAFSAWGTPVGIITTVIMIVMVIVLYMIANRAYNHAMNENEE